MSLPSPTVHRKQLYIRDEQTLQLPRGAVVLHLSAGYLGVGPNAQQLIEIWYHCDLDAPLVERRFRVVGTGHLADVDPVTHLGTVIHDRHVGGRGVWHVFDLGEVVQDG